MTRVSVLYPLKAKKSRLDYTHSNAITDELKVRYFTGNATVEEKRQLLAWLNESPDNERELFILKDIYESGIAANQSIDAQTEEGWRQLKKMIDASPQHEKKQARWLRLIRNYAAIFMLGVLLGSFTVLYLKGSHSTGDATHEPVAKQFEIRTEKGERATVHLPDGSKVALNACSYLSYTADFNENARELTLIGEGYFDVQTNPDLPFTVKTSGLNIKAFGTVFNVRAYSDEDVVETTLVEGDVTIETLTHQKIVSLRPSQVITIPKELIGNNREHEYISRTETQDRKVKQDNTSLRAKEPKKAEAVLINNINPEVYVSWKDNKWVIKSESLESLATKIERKYDVEISIEEESLKNYVFSGTLKNYPLEQVLETIRLTAPIKYIINENNVIISEDKELKKRYEKLILSTP